MEHPQVNKSPSDKKFQFSTISPALCRIFANKSNTVHAIDSLKCCVHCTLWLINIHWADRQWLRLQLWYICIHCLPHLPGNWVTNNILYFVIQKCTYWGENIPRESIKINWIFRPAQNILILCALSLRRSELIIKIGPGCC